MKRALLVGINDYSLTGCDLNNCVNDIDRWSSLLMGRYQFKRGNIRILINDRATKEKVSERLNWLVESANEGDTLVFLYSGHGATFTERDELGYLDEAKDEALKLYGLGTNSLLVDDELNQIFRNLSPAVKLIIICDCCFSGGMSDAITGEIEMDDIPKAKYHPLPYDLEHRNDPNSPIRAFGYCLSKEEGLHTLNRQDFSHSKSLLIAACEENEFAAQGGPITEGLSVFTFFATQVLNSSGMQISAKELIRLIRQKMADEGYSQTPQLKGRQDLFDQPLFG
jgi:hypothetical protein